MLTIGLDAVAGGAGNDTINDNDIYLGLDGTTPVFVKGLTAAEAIVGGNGNDTLNVVSAPIIADPTTDTVSDVEPANLKSNLDVTATSKAWTVLTALNSTAVGSSTLTAAATTDEVSTITAAGVASTVTGVNNVTVNASGNATTATAGITVNKAAGNV